MFATLSSLSFLLTSANLLRLALASPTFADSNVAYLTNCITSDTQVSYSEVSFYNDVDQSFAGQGPDLYSDTGLGATTTWEGNQVSWNYAGSEPSDPNTFVEFINANSQDPSVPAFTNVGCGTYTDSFDGGQIIVGFLCYKDQPRQLYATSDHECSTLYYCRIVPGQCPFTAPGAALVKQAEL